MTRAGTKRARESPELPVARSSDPLDWRIEGTEALPLIGDARGAPKLEALTDWLSDRHDWVQTALIRHGAILLRGFDVSDAAAFERVCRAIAPDVTADFVGTPGTRFTETVYPASEGPTEYPIPPHCELMYLPTPPRHIFFGCLEPPGLGTGETPIVDTRRVWAALDPKVRERFERGGMRIVRNLCGPKSRFRLWTQVRWDEFFLTTDRDRVEELCRSQDFAFEWTRDDGLRLEFAQPVTRAHPVTKEIGWCNQLLSYDVSSNAHEFRRLQRLRPSFRQWKMWQFVRLTSMLKERSPASTLVAYCTYADGSPIPTADRYALRKTVWDHLVAQPWQRGDVLAVDNFATAHARYPAWGTRRIVACMA